VHIRAVVTYGNLILQESLL